MATMEARIERVPFSGCWLWTGYVDRDGYGKFGRLCAHRAVYELIVGPIPGGAELDHLCRVRCCVNPAHLEPVGRLLNMLRSDNFTAANARKTHCPRGHAYTVASRGYLRRVCLICEREANRRCYAKRVAA